MKSQTYEGALVHLDCYNTYESRIVMLPLGRIVVTAGGIATANDMRKKSSMKVAHVFVSRAA